MERRPVPFVFAIPVVLGMLLLTGMLGWGYAQRHRPHGGTGPAPIVSAPSKPATPAAAVSKPAAVVAVVDKPAPQAAPARETYLWPVTAPISSTFGPRWGRFHSGLDLAANMGDPIKASRGGEVVLAREYEDYGLAIILRHADGTETLYGHCSVLKVKVGEKVEQGQVIGLVGSTGLSTGPHVHFEVRVNDQARDPLLYLPPNQYVHR